MSSRPDTCTIGDESGGRKKVRKEEEKIKYYKLANSYDWSIFTGMWINKKRPIREKQKKKLETILWVKKY